MADVLEYKCPSCGGALRFDSGIQKMKCPFCDTEFDVETLKAYDDVLKNERKDEDPHWIPYDQTSGNGDWTEEEREHLRAYNCNSCGAQIIGDETLAATSCPYCGNPVVMTDQFTGTLKPDYVIPFQLDKEAAKAAFLQNMKGKILLPRFFKSEATLNEIKGLYVPFWLFDCDTDSSIRYRGTRTMTWSDANYIYTKTDNFLVLREGNLSFCRVPVDGSIKMDDAYMEAIEPFDYTALTDFQTAYLAGYLANRYDQDAAQSEERANARIRQSVADTFASTAKGYATLTPQDVKIALQRGEIRYAMLPVWTLNAAYRGKVYSFAMNGQTGKFVGELPMDKGKFWGLMLAFTAGFSAIAAGLGFLLHLL